jgi:hypothetical protein
VAFAIDVVRSRGVAMVSAKRGSLSLLLSYVLRGAATSQIDERSTLDHVAVQAVMQSAFEIF